MDPAAEGARRPGGLLQQRPRPGRRQQALAAEGASVRHLRTPTPTSSPAPTSRVSAMGDGDVLSVPVDLCDENAAAAWVRDTAATLGGIDIVVTNSGGVPFGPVDAFGVADYRAAIDANLIPHIALTLAALPYAQGERLGAAADDRLESVEQPHPERPVVGGQARPARLHEGPGRRAGSAAA